MTTYDVTVDTHSPDHNFWAEIVGFAKLKGTKARYCKGKLTIRFPFSDLPDLRNCLNDMLSPKAKEYALVIGDIIKERAK